MENTGFSPELLPQLVDLINAHISLVPPYWHLGPSEVENLLARAPQLWDDHCPDCKREYDESRIFCLTEQGELIAAGQLNYSLQPIIDKKFGSIGWILAKPDNESGLRRLLDQIVSFAKQADINRIYTSRCTFGIGWSGISDTWPHLLTGFDLAGFTPSYRWLLFKGTTDSVDEKKTGLPIEITRYEEFNEWHMHAYLHDHFVGECEAWKIPNHFSNCPDCSNWFTIEYIGLVPRVLRLGIGSHLLAEQLRWQRELGRQNGLLWTEGDNQAMIGLAKSMGFTICGEALQYEKDL